MTTAIPDWLRTLRTSFPPPRTVAATAAFSGPTNLVGAICRTIAMDGQGDRALVLVVASDAARGTHTVLLLSPDVLLATASDVLLPQSATGLPFELLAQTDLFGYVWDAQLDGNLGWVSQPLSARIVDAITARAAADTALAAGPPVTVERDPRWGHKLAELARLGVLTDSCTRQLVDGEPHLLVDPVSLVPGNGGALELEEFVLSLALAVQDGETEIPGWVLEALLTDPQVTDAYLDAGAGTALQLLAQLREHALSAMPTQAEPEPSHALEWRRSSLIRASGPAARGSILLRDRLLAGELEHGHGCVRMLSRLRIADVVGVSVIQIGGRLVQCLTEGIHQ